MREALRQLDVALFALVAGAVLVSAVVTSVSMRDDVPSTELLVAGGVVCVLGIAVLRWSQK